MMKINAITNEYITSVDGNISWKWPVAGHVDPTNELPLTADIWHARPEYDKVVIINKQIALLQASNESH